MTLHIGRLPGRKSLCLYEMGGGVITSLAYFRSESDARRAMEIIDGMTHLAPSEEWHGWRTLGESDD